MKKILFLVALTVMPMLLFGQEKIGYINSSEVMMLMPELDQVEKDMAKYNKEKEDYLKTMYDEMQAKYEKYEKERETMSESMRKVTEQDLQSMGERFQTAQTTFQQEAQAEQQKLLKPLQEKLQNAINAVGKKQSFLYIIDTTSGALVYKSDKMVDVTSAVKKELGII